MANNHLAGARRDRDSIDTAYDPQAIEQDLYQRWESAGYFAASGKGEPYCIVIPPPNVTGSLHMGHAFQDTIMDALIRYHRMRGFNTLWQGGTDHAGIATQMVVERQLIAEGSNRHDLGRDEFVERIWRWKEESGGTITNQLRRMGASVDWRRERFTMDEGLSNAVKEVFIRLHEDGLIYRGKRLVNWDPVLHTAISDLEVISEEESGHLWHLKYPITKASDDDADDYLIVATTRPETMLGDSAVAVHPEDERYAHLVGKTVDLPLVNRKIPIIADDYVDMEFGSGCVKITPAHDFNDYEVGQRHDLPLINVFDDDASIDLAGSDYHGLDRYQARERVVADLSAQGLLDRVDDHKLMVPRGDRTNVVIEPYLTNQWFVRAEALAKPSIEAVEDGRIRFVPDNWKRTYFEWMHNIQDWCISRQLWWGHRIPAWYDEDGNIFVAQDEADALAKAKQKHGKDVALKQDEDVLDTWFSSALWPFSTLGWPEDTEEVNTFYPTTVLVTGFDIIFFWVARMIMFGLKFADAVPFHEVYIHGLVRDADGQKMSKSKGNVLDPLDLIDGISLDALVEKRTTGLMQPQLAERIAQATKRQYPDGIPAYGTDALRFTFAILATQGRDIRFDLGRIGGYRNFCNKLWNASRFVLLNVDGQACGQRNEAYQLGIAEKWVISRLQETEQLVADGMATYRFDRVAQSLYSFVWDEYCDWYLELAKITLNDPDINEEIKTGTRRTLVRVLETTLRLLHPLMPFITDALWKRVAPFVDKQGDSVMVEPYPIAEPDKIDDHACQEIDWLKSVVSAIRNLRAERNIDPRKPLPLIVEGAETRDRERLNLLGQEITGLAKVASIAFDDRGMDDSAMALVGGLKLHVPLGAFIDKKEERSRLQREIDKRSKDKEKVSAKLNNPAFVDKAPAAVVDKERDRLEALTSQISELEQQLTRIK